MKCRDILRHLTKFDIFMNGIEIQSYCTRQTQTHVNMVLGPQSLHFTIDSVMKKSKDIFNHPALLLGKNALQDFCYNPVSEILRRFDIQSQMCMNFFSSKQLNNLSILNPNIPIGCLVYIRCQCQKMRNERLTHCDSLLLKTTAKSKHGIKECSTP